MRNKIASWGWILQEKVIVLILCASTLILFCARKPVTENGIELFKRGEYPKAIKTLNIALQQTPTPEVHYYLSLAYAYVDSVDQSLHHYHELALTNSDLKDDFQLRELVANFLGIDPYPASIIPMPTLNQYKGSFHPDGEIVAVAAAKRDITDIYLIALDGHTIAKIIKGRTNTDPDFSYSGESLVFVSNRDGDDELYLYYLKNKKIEKLTDNTAQDFSPSFSPDGQEVVFVSDMNKGWEIYKMDLVNRKISRLTKNSYWDGFPKFSNDGNWIVFSSRRRVNEDIFLMNKNGGEEKLIFSSPAEDNDPILYGTQLYFKSNKSGDWEIYKMDLKTNLVIRLTNNQYPEWNPRLAKDGNKILFSRKTKKSWQLYFANFHQPVTAGILNLKIQERSAPKSP